MTATHSRHRESPAGDGTRRTCAVTPGEILAAIPAALGFRPSPGDLVFLGGRETAGAPAEASAFLCRSLPDPADPAAWHEVTNRAARVLAAQGYGVIAAVGYGEDSAVSPFAHVLAQAADARGLRLSDFFRVQDGRYWCCLCQDCCSPAGTDFTAEEEAAARLPGGDRVPASLGALAATIAPAGGDAARAMRAATDRALDRAARLAPGPAADQGRAAVAGALARCRDGGAGEPSYGQAARVLAALRDPSVRDGALRRMDHGGREDHRRLWAGLTRLAPPGCAAAPACLLAFTAWQCGDGTLASIALRRALADDPADETALILTDIIDSGLSWEFALRQLSPKLAAIWGEADGP